MGWIGPVLAGASAIAGLFGGKKSNSTVDKTVTTTPTYDPSQLGFRDYLTNLFKSNIDNSNAFGAALKTQGIQNIQSNANAASRSVDDFLTSRGLGRTTAGASALTDTSYRAGSQIASFLNQLPLTLDARRTGLINNAAGFFTSLPVASTQKTTGYDNTSAGPSSPAAGFFGGAAQGLAAYLGQINAQKTLGDILKGAGGVQPGGTPAPDYGPYG